MGLSMTALLEAAKNAFYCACHEAAMSDQLAKVGGDRSRLKVIYPSPRGLKLEQNVFDSLAGWLKDDHRICVLCGRYEGVDERAVGRWVDLEVSLGDFIVTGGELPGLILVDGLVRCFQAFLAMQSHPKTRASQMDYSSIRNSRNLGNFLGILCQKSF